MDLSKDKYKLSQYNVVYQDEDFHYIWNTYSNALMKLDEASQDYMKSFSDCSLPDDGSKEFALLKENGFIVYEKIDEFGRICLIEKQNMFNANPESLCFIIAPGMGCNYKCKYCFEAGSDITGIMSREVADEVSKYICQQVKRNPNAKKLYISWFGGEPLLYIDTIEIISRILVEYTDQNNIEYHAGIVTNGRFLDEETVAKLLDLRVMKAQITVDGTERIYCASKFATKEDFESVIRNIKYASDKIKISIRLNIPDNDAKEAIETTDFLFSDCDLPKHANIHFAFINDYSQSRNNDIEHQSFRNYIESHLVWFQHLVDKYGVSNDQKVGNDRKLTHCGLVCMGTACIGPRGELYKCEHDFGNDLRIMGDIWRGRYYNKEESIFYSAIDSPEKQKCLNCKYTPMCLGGCMNHYLIHYGGFDCEAYQRLSLKLKLYEGGVESWNY